MKNKGFTLIELLAVILILGIIALIAIPTVNDIIYEAKKGAFKTGVQNIASSVEQTCTLQQFNGQTLTTEYNFSSTGSTPKLDVKGTLPTSGTIIVDSDCNISIAVSDDSFCARKSTTDDEVTIGKVENDTCVINSGFASYVVGDQLTLPDGSFWYVVEASDSSNQYVKLLSKYNINLTTNLQDATDNSYPAINPLNYENASTALESFKNSLNLGTNITNCNLIDPNLLVSLGCDYENRACHYETYNVHAPEWVYSSTYWANVNTNNASTNYPYIVSTAGSESAIFFPNYYVGEQDFGLRPYIVVSKTVVELVD